MVGGGQGAELRGDGPVSVVLISIADERENRWGGLVGGGGGGSGGG